MSFLPQVEQNWATLQGGEMTIQTTQASEATQAVASLAEAAVAASQEMQQGATVTMALNRWRQGWGEEMSMANLFFHTGREMYLSLSQLPLEFNTVSP